MMPRRSSVPTRILLILLLSPLLHRPVVAAEGKDAVAGRPAQETLRMGEAMYVKGVLPSGRPMKAIVQGDIPVAGTIVPCANCHMRSGLGSFEGNVLTPPTNGAKLFGPLRSVQDIPGNSMGRDFFKFKRPAYTEKSLARALRSGVDPTGRMFSKTMPRYDLDDGEMEILVHYLKGLSTGRAPGVTGDSIRVATVVAGGVGARQRDAMLKPLSAFLDKEWNAKLPVMKQLQREKGYRKILLDVWTLSGPAGTWGDQLDALYRRRPVFALLGGIAAGPWSPVHEFCQKNGIPCAFPLTDLPAISETDRYTLYFSKGYYQEGESAAKFLARVFDLPPGKEVVQVYRDGDEGNALAQGVSDAWKKLGKASLTGRVLSPGEKTDMDFWRGLSAAHPNAVMLLWLGPGDFSALEALGNVKDRPSTIFVSSRMLTGKLSTVPEAVREFTFLTYPMRLPEEKDYVSSVVTQWMKLKSIPLTDLAVSSKSYFLTRMLGKVLTDMRGDAYREYFLDLFDVLEDQHAYGSVSLRLTFGPGQRYASKGCYIVTLTKGGKPKVVKQSDWVVY